MNATTDSTWTSTATLAELAERVRSCTRLLCLTHSKPDGDAIGSTLALARSAIHIGKAASVLYLAPWPERFNPVLGPTPVIHEHQGCFNDPSVTTADLVAVLDTGSWNQVADAKPFLQARADRVFIVDHHAHGNPDMTTTRHINSRAASACELVAELCRLVLGKSSCRELPVDVATALYLGVATDTGWFRYSNVTSATMRLAADLIDAGAPANDLHQLSEQSDTPARLKLTTHALESLQLLDHNRVAIMSLTKAQVEAAGGTVDETGGLSDLPNRVSDVRVVAILVELEPGLTKLSLRSKAPRPTEKLIDVNRIAQQFNGGGHVHAAGAKMHMPLKEALAAVAAALSNV